MKVKALQKGYSGGRVREVGEVFEVEDKSLLGRWMEPLDQSEDVPADRAALEAEAAKLGLTGNIAKWKYETLLAKVEAARQVG